MTLTEINIDNFLKKDISIVLFKTTWFKPFKMMEPMIEKVSKDLNIEIGILDIERFPEITTFYQVKTIPTFIILRKGNIENTIEGVISEEDLKTFLKKT